jgi:hypothetical protein
MYFQFLHNCSVVFSVLHFIVIVLSHSLDENKEYMV